MSAEDWQDGYNYYNPGEGVLYEEKRPWQLLSIVSNFIPQNGQVLDVGCGNGKKLQDLIRIYKPSATFTAFDLNWKQLLKAKNSFLEANLNINLRQSNAQSTFPFPSKTFDTVTFMLSPHNAEEAHRVLKPGGTVIMERTGELDKRDVKTLFGYDDFARPRGYNCEFAKGQLARIYSNSFNEAGFMNIGVAQGTWKSYHSPEGLAYLLEHTPLVRDYNPKTDKKIFDDIVKKNSTPNGVVLTQHRILIVAKKGGLTA